jgi:two-component system response regulator AtoC
MSGVIRFSLNKAGFDVTTAKCGQTAWNLLQEQDFDLLVSDFQMPGLTGGELCERIRNDPRLAPLPVILLTAKGMELESARYLDDLSVSTIMSKPFSPKELVRVVETCLTAEAAGP